MRPKAGWAKKAAGVGRQDADSQIKVEACFWHDMVEQMYDGTQAK